MSLLIPMAELAILGDDGRELPDGTVGEICVRGSNVMVGYWKRPEEIREAAVVGEPHKLHGEIPVAYVSLKEGARATAEEVREFCRESLGLHEIPKRVHFVGELPKTASGKILKRELRKHGRTRGSNHSIHQMIYSPPRTARTWRKKPPVDLSSWAAEPS